MNIIVDNLPVAITEEELNATFETYGRVTKVVLSDDGSSGIVEMPLRLQAITAIQYLQDTTMYGNSLSVNIMREGSDRRGETDRRSTEVRRNIEESRDKHDRQILSKVIDSGNRRTDEDRREEEERRFMGDRRE